jgi:hypothetical protein
MTEHAGQLTEHAEVLRVELLDAHTQIRAYQTQQELVRQSVADLSDRVAALYEIVQRGAAPEAQPAGPPPAEASAQLPHPEGR